MSAALYTLDILRLAAATAEYPRLAQPVATGQRRSVTCGSTMTVDLDVDRDQRVTAYGHEVRACALGQASAALLAQGVVGRSPVELEAVRRQLAAWLVEASAPAPDWPQIEVLAPARHYPARHGAIRLPFEAAAEAAAKVVA